jgi:protein O-GlcNAc transferase
VPGLLNLAQAMRDKGDLPAAVDSYRRAIVSKPNSADAHADLAFTLKRMDKLKEALAEVVTAVRLAPNLARAQFYYGEILAQMGDSAGALPHYKRASELSPRDAYFKLKYGTLLAETSPSEAVLMLQEASQLSPKRPDILNALGAALRRAGDQQRAAEAFRQSREASAAAINRTEAVLKTNSAIESLKKGEVLPAIESLRAALVADPDFSDANHYMGIAQSAQQNWPEANRAFSAAVQASPSNPQIHFNYGVALEKQGDWSNAARQFEVVVSLRPAEVEARCQLAAALMHAGQAERAQTELENAEQLGSCEAAKP